MNSGYSDYNFTSFFKYCLKLSYKTSLFNDLQNILNYFKTFSGYNLYMEKFKIKDGDQEKDPIIILKN